MNSETDPPSAVPATADPAPPKKSKKPLIVGLVTAGALALALAVAGALAAADASARADDAADQYISDVQSHIDAIFGAEDFRARAEVVDDRAVLTEVMFGETMSESYRTALDIEAEYEALINDASPILKQRHSSTDLRAFLGDLSDILGETISLNEVGIRDQASLDATKETAAAMVARAETFSAQSVRVQNWVYPEKYQSDQREAAEALELMAETWAEVAAITEEYIALWEAHLRAEEGDDEPSSVAMSIDAVTAVAAEYRVHTRGLTDAMERLVTDVVNDGFLEDVENQAFELQSRFESLEARLETLRSR